MRKTKVILSLFIFLSLALPSTFVFAQEIAQSEQLQSVNEKLQAEIESQETPEESQRALIQKALDVTRVEIDELQISLEGLVLEDKELVMLKSIYQAYLEKVEEDFANFQLRFEDESLDLSMFAEELKQWRLNYYDSNNKEIFSFLLLPNIAEALNTALVRVDKIESDLDSFKKYFKVSVNNQLSSLLDEAKSDLDQANLGYLETKESLIQEGQLMFTELNMKDADEGIVKEIGETIKESIDNILNIESPSSTVATSTDITVATSTVVTSSSPTESVQELKTYPLEEVLIHIKSAYQKFLEMSKIAREEADS